MNKFVLLLLGCVSQVAYAGVYKWVDDNGHVQYGERPPATASQVKPMKLKPSPPQSAEAQEEYSSRAMKRKQEQEQKQKQEAKLEAIVAKERAIAEVHEKNCKVARSNLNTITMGGRVFNMDDKGNRIFVSDAQRESKTQEAMKAVEKWCR